MTVEILEDKVLLKHAKTNSSAEVYFHGATVTSWKHNGIEQLFLSTTAVLDGSKAIRGGIPLVFPQFGLDPAMPKQQHGFARVSRWHLASQKSENEAETVATFELTSSEKTKEVWPYEFKLNYVVKLSDALETKLIVENLSKEPFSFTALLHTYFHADIAKVVVKGLKGVSYEDKVQKDVKTQQEDVKFGEEVDRVYYGIKDTKYEIVDNRKVTIKSTFKDVVVWNPWIEKGKSMSDLHQEGYKEFVCVEVGNVHQPVQLAPGNKFEAGQVLKISHL